MSVIALSVLGCHAGLLLLFMFSCMVGLDSLVFSTHLLCTVWNLNVHFVCVQQYLLKNAGCVSDYFVWHVRGLYVTVPKMIPHMSCFLCYVRGYASTKKFFRTWARSKANGTSVSTL